MIWHTLITTMDTYVETHAPELVVVVPVTIILLCMVSWHLGFKVARKEIKLDIAAALDVISNPELPPNMTVRIVQKLLKGGKT